MAEVTPETPLVPHEVELQGPVAATTALAGVNNAADAEVELGPPASIVPLLLKRCVGTKFDEASTGSDDPIGIPEGLRQPLLESTTLRTMDRSAAMPHAAWVEVRGEDGELLQSIPASIRGGTVSAEIPGFPPGTFGTVQMQYSPPEDLEEDSPQVKELPTRPTLMVVELG